MRHIEELMGPVWSDRAYPKWVMRGRDEREEAAGELLRVQEGTQVDSILHGEKEILMQFPSHGR